MDKKINILLIALTVISAASSIFLMGIGKIFSSLGLFLQTIVFIGILSHRIEQKNLNNYFSNRRIVIEKDSFIISNL